VAKNKLKHIAELETFSNVYQLRSDLKGKWNKEVFKNGYPITLELACGKGEYTLGLARKFPQRNFIGIDIKGPRLWRGAKTALEENLSNVIFLRTFIDHIADYFEEGEVDQIWITFPDPHHGSGGDRRRLTAKKYLSLYKKILVGGGVIHLKTDDLFLYQFTISELSETGGTVIMSMPDLYKEYHCGDDILSIKTFYELQHLRKGKTIKYIKFTPA
jgi:tRNA (guanine-N7-)-methyltransferase